MLEVDFEYLQYLHDLHKDFPFYAKHWISSVSKLTNLMTTLYKKEKYILHYHSLKKVFCNGLILNKMHAVTAVFPKELALIDLYICLFDLYTLLLFINTYKLLIFQEKYILKYPLVCYLQIRQWLILTE